MSNKTGLSDNFRYPKPNISFFDKEREREREKRDKICRRNVFSAVL